MTSSKPSAQDANRRGFAVRLRAQRKARGLGQAALATRMGISANAQSNYERGIREPTLGYLYGLHALDFDIVELLFAQQRTVGKSMAMADPFNPQAKGAVERHAQALYCAAFSAPRQARSIEYKTVFIALLEHRLEGAALQCPYAHGSTQADAWHAGGDEARAVLFAQQVPVAAQ